VDVSVILTDFGPHLTLRLDRTRQACADLFHSRRPRFDFFVRVLPLPFEGCARGHMQSPRFYCFCLFLFEIDLLDLYHPETDTRIRCNALNITEDLGQVDVLCLSPS